MKAIETIITLVLATCMLSLSYRCGKEAAKWDANAAAMRMVEQIVIKNTLLKADNELLKWRECDALARSNFYFDELADCRGWNVDSLRVNMFVETLRVSISDSSHYKGMRVTFTSIKK